MIELKAPPAGPPEKSVMFTPEHHFSPSWACAAPAAMPITLSPQKGTSSVCACLPPIDRAGLSGPFQKRFWSFPLVMPLNPGLSTGNSRRLPDSDRLQ
jgi:hypothetical protein